MRNRILSVDDDLDMRQMISSHLVNAGYIVYSAANARQAWERMQTLTFDLLILDISMPEVSGLRFVELIRSSDRFQDLPVLMLTSSAELDDVMGLRDRISDYVLKPYSK